MQELLDIAKTLNSQSSFASINAAFSERPVLYLNAIRMWLSFPLFGVGLGNFYHLFPLFNVEHIGNGVVIKGENAHNYFLQALSETGIFGIFSLIMILAIPFLMIRDRRLLIPGAMALLSLLLGNLYSHSFLVRENLLLAAIFLGLLYSYVPEDGLKKSLLWLRRKFSAKPVVLLCFILALLFLGSREVYKSFYTFPFEYGTSCFISKPLTLDWWSAGVYDVPLPRGFREISMPIHVARPDINQAPLSASFLLIDLNNQVLSVNNYIWTDNGLKVVEARLPGYQLNEVENVRARLRLSSCYTPRNMGESGDGRKLGVLVDDPIMR
jgi:hypothetical protein